MIKRWKAEGGATAVAVQFNAKVRWLPRLPLTSIIMIKFKFQKGPPVCLGPG